MAAFGEFDEGLRALEKQVVETALKFADSFDDPVGQQWEEAGESLDLAFRAARLIAPSARVLFDSSYRPASTSASTEATPAQAVLDNVARVGPAPSLLLPPLVSGNVSKVVDAVASHSRGRSQAVLDNLARVGPAPSLPLPPLVSRDVSKAVDTVASHSRGREDVIEVKRKLVEINEATEASGSAPKRHRRRHVGDLEPPNAMDNGQEDVGLSAARNWERAGSLNSPSPFPTKSEVTTSIRAPPTLPTKSEVTTSIRAPTLEEPPVTDSAVHNSESCEKNAVVMGKDPFSKRLDINRDLFEGSLSPEPYTDIDTDIDRDLVDGSLSPDPYEAQLAEILANPFFADLRVEGRLATSSKSKVQLTSGEQAEVCSSSQVNDNLVIVIMFLPLYRKACQKGLTWLKPGSWTSDSKSG